MYTTLGSWQRLTDLPRILVVDFPMASCDHNHQLSPLKPLNFPRWTLYTFSNWFSRSTHFVSLWLPLRARDLFDLHFLYQTHHSAIVILSGLLNLVMLSVCLQAARKYADLRPLFLVLNVKLTQIEIRWVKVRGKVLLKVNHSDLLI